MEKKNLSEKSSRDEQCSEILIHFFLPLFPSPSSLCRAPSNRVKGASFRPMRAMAVDLFPQTRHCELLIFFERVEYANGSSAAAAPAASEITAAACGTEGGDGISPAGSEGSQAAAGHGDCSPREGPP